MDQHITLNIAGTPYNFKVVSPEQEEYMRRAVEIINKNYLEVSALHSNYSLANKLSIAFLKVEAYNLQVQDAERLADVEVDELKALLDRYLENEENK